MQLRENLMSKWKKKAEDQIAVNQVHQLTLIEKKVWMKKKWANAWEVDFGVL